MTAAKVATLAEFLLARIAEDYRRAERLPVDDTVRVPPLAASATTAPCPYCRGEFFFPRAGDLSRYFVPSGHTDLRDGRARCPWAPWSRARVLAECKSKRRIVEELRDLSGEDADDQAWALEYGDNAQRVAITTLRLLALPYADHSEYRDEWRP